MDYQVTGYSHMRLTAGGKAGAALFLGGWIGAAVFSWLFYSGLVRNANERLLSFERTDVTPLGLLAGASAIAVLVGFVLLLVGRETIHRLRVADTPRR